MITIRVSIKNYQIIKQAVLDFKPGFTVLVGPSNNGKSSIIKAVKSAVYTEPGTTPIRNGSDSYVVGIQKDDHTVIYQKKSGSTKYLVDGEQYSKFGVSTPEEVSRALNIKELVLNGSKYQLNFWNQMDKPFLLDKSGGDLFKFIVDSGENDQLSGVLKSMVSDRQSINKEADVIQGSIKSTEDMIKEQQSFLDKNESLLKEADNIIDMKEKYNQCESISTLTDEFIKNDTEISNNKKFLSKNSKMLESFDALSEIENLFNQNNKIFDLWYDYVNNRKVLSDLQEELDKYNCKIDVLNKPDINRMISVKTLCDEYINICNEYNKASEINLMLKKSIPSNEIIDNLSKFIDLQKIYNDLIKISNSKKEVQKDIDNKKDELNKLDSVNELIKVCPYCGQKIGGNHVHREDN